MGKIKCYAGIDPGLTGGITLIFQDGKIWAWRMPTIISERKVGGKKRKRSNIDLENLREIMFEVKSAGAHVGLENVNAMPGQGSTSMFNFGRTRGILEGMLSAFEISYELITPQKWSMMLHTDYGHIEGTKDRSQAAGVDIFGESIPRLKSGRIHDGILDAGLIAMFMKRRDEK